MEERESLDLWGESLELEYAPDEEEVFAHMGIVHVNGELVHHLRGRAREGVVMVVRV